MRGTRSVWLAVGALALTRVWAGPPELRAQAGFGRLAAAQVACPVRVEVAAVDGPASGQVVATFRTGETEQPVETAAVEVDVPAGGVQTFWLYGWPSDTSAALPVDFLDRRGRRTRVAANLQRLDDEAQLVVVVGPSRTGLRFLRRERTETPSQTKSGSWQPRRLLAPATEVANVAAADLPPDAAAYESVHSLVLADDTVTAAPVEVREAIAGWVSAGGHLVLVGGAAAAGLGQDPVITRLSPVNVSGLALLPGEAFAPLAARYGGTLPAGGQYAVSRARLAGGRTLLALAGRPFVAERSVGRGRVSWVAAAYDQPPLAAWAGQTALWRDLLGWRRDRPIRAAVWAALRRPLLSQAAIQAPAMGWVAGYLGLYLVVLLAVQFPLLRRLRRPELAWVVTPLIVVIFSLGAYFLGAALKGRQVTLQSVGVARTGSGATTASWTGLVGLFAPARSNYPLALPAGGRLALLRDTGESYWYGYGYGTEVSLLDPATRLQVLHTPAGVRAPDLRVDMWALRLLGVETPLPLGGSVQVESRGPRIVVRNGLPQPLLQGAVRTGAGWHTLPRLPAGGHVALRANQRGGLALPQALQAGDLAGVPASLLEDAVQALTRNPSEHGPDPGDAAPLPPAGLTGPILLAWYEPVAMPLALERLKPRTRHLCLLVVTATGT